jgi:hypothetical protein
MLRVLAILIFLSPLPVVAQTASDHSSTGMSQHTMDHSKMHDQMTGRVPMEPGQSAFAAIHEIVGLLEADPNTEWAKVNIDALREHLVDMDAVTLHAQINSEAVENSIRFTATGEEPVRSSIRRMIAAHASTMNGVDGWRFVAAETESGATLTVTAPEPYRAKVLALGFFGILTLGMHHQEHHLMIARGGDPHH